MYSHRKANSVRLSGGHLGQAVVGRGGVDDPEVAVDLCRRRRGVDTVTRPVGDAGVAWGEDVGRDLDSVHADSEADLRAGVVGRGAVRVEHVRANGRRRVTVIHGDALVGVPVDAVGADDIAPGPGRHVDADLVPVDVVADDVGNRRGTLACVGGPVQRVRGAEVDAGSPVGPADVLRHGVVRSRDANAVLDRVVTHAVKNLVGSPEVAEVNVVARVIVHVAPFDDDLSFLARRAVADVDAVTSGVVFLIPVDLNVADVAVVVAV